MLGVGRKKKKNYQHRIVCLAKNVVKMLVTHSCPILCDPMDYSLPGSSVHSILQARLQEWVATGNLPNPGIKPRSPALQADSLSFATPGKPSLVL